MYPDLLKFCGDKNHQENVHACTNFIFISKNLTVTQMSSL